MPFESENYEDWTEADLQRMYEQVAACQLHLSAAGVRSKNPVVRRRATRVEHVLRSAGMMLRADPYSDEVANVARYIAGNIRNGIGAYGLDVVESGQPKRFD